MEESKGYEEHAFTKKLNDIRKKQTESAIIKQGDALSTMADSLDELVSIYARERERKQDETYEVTFKLENIKDLQMLSRYKDAFLFIDHFQNYLRAQWKYAETPDDINTIYDKYCSAIVGYGVSFD